MHLEASDTRSKDRRLKCRICLKKTSYKCDKCSGTGDPFAICKPAISDCWNDYHLKREYDVPSSQSEVQSQSQDTDV